MLAGSLTAVLKLERDAVLGNLAEFVDVNVTGTIEVEPLEGTRQRSWTACLAHDLVPERIDQRFDRIHSNKANSCGVCVLPFFFRKVVPSDNQLAWWWIWSLNFAHAYVRCHHRPLPRIALRDRRVIFDIGLAAGVGGVSVKIRGDIWHEGIWFGFVLMLLSYNESARGVLLEGSRVLVTHLRDVTAVAWDGDIFAPWRVWLIKIAWRRSHHCCCCAD